MLLLLGDIHAMPDALENACRVAKQAGAAAVLQVGDFGVYPHVIEYFYRVAEASEVPIYFIDGNHEKFPIISRWWDEMEEEDSSIYELVADKLFYVRRGSVLNLDGRRIAFLGGAGSIDFAYRTRGYDWFDEEQIREQDIARLVEQVNGKPIDMLLTHVPPQRVVTKHFDLPIERALRVRQAFGAPDDWFDPSAHKLDAVWEQLGLPQVYCGHMHRKLVDGNCRILDIDEMALV